MAVRGHRAGRLGRAGASFLAARKPPLSGSACAAWPPARWLCWGWQPVAGMVPSSGAWSCGQGGAPSPAPRLGCSAAASRGAQSPCAVRVWLRGDGLAPHTCPASCDDCPVSPSQLLSARWRQHPVTPSAAPQAITGSLGKGGDLEGKLEGETHCSGPGVLLGAAARVRGLCPCRAVPRSGCRGARGPRPAQRWHPHLWRHCSGWD